MPPNGAIVAWVSFLSKALQIILIPVMAWALTVERRVSAMELEHWTEDDQAVHADTVRLEQSAIRLELENIRGLMALKADSDDLLDREEIDRRFDEVRERLRRLEGGDELRP